jgi:hypothetical protein
MSNTSHLVAIENRQRRSLVRDAFFALSIATFAVVSLTSVGTACHAATTPVHVAQR